jgi:hypothetical protein
MGLGFLFITTGLVQAGLDEEFFPRFHVPLLTAALGIPPLFLGLLAALSRGEGSRGRLLVRNAGTASLLFLACGLGSQWAAEGVEREERFDMTWAARTYSYGSEERAGVLLAFADHPGWTTDVASRDLADHLASLGARRVPVVFRVIRDYGRLRRFKVIRVAGFRGWSYDGHVGWTGHSGWRTALVPLREGLDPAPIR